MILLIAGIASAATLLGPALTTDFDFTNSPEAKRAQQILEDRRLTEDVITETFVVVGDPGAIEDPAFADRVNGFIAELQGLGTDVFAALPASFPMTEEQAADPQVAALGPIPSEDGSAVLFTGVYAGDIDEASPHFEDVEAAREAASVRRRRGLHARGGQLVRGLQGHLRGGPRASARAIGVTAAIIVLLIVFGAIVAGLTPAR